jgi:hypothetical protein
MPIKVACKCGQSFAAKDELAGRTVNCPKCKQPLKIPAPSAPAKQPARTGPQPAPKVAAGGPVGGPAVSDLGGLFDEVGVVAEAPTAGPRCPSCGKGLAPHAVLCVNCGFNLQTGQRVATMAPHVAPSGGHGHDPLEGQAEEMIAKAAREIAEQPISAEGKDFGEGTNPLSWLLALCLPLIFAIAVFAVIFWGRGLGEFLALVGVGIGSGNPLLIMTTLLALMFFIVVMVSWFKLTFSAMEDHVLFGLLSIIGLGIFPAVYGFIRWRKLLMWAIAYVASTILTILCLVGVVVIVVVMQVVR